MSTSSRNPLMAGLLPLGFGLQSLGLALMTGGMLALGAFTAPVLFSHFSRDAAAPVMAIIFRRYDMVLLAALGLVLLGETLRIASRQLVWKTKVAALRVLLLLGLTGMLLYSVTTLNPKIQQMNQAGVHRNLTSEAGQRFDRLHKQSEGFYKIELLCAVLLIVLTPFATRVESEVPPHTLGGAVADA